MPNTEQALVVLHPFRDFTKGQIIADPAEIKAILGSGQNAFVVSAQLPIDQVPSTDKGEDH